MLYNFYDAAIQILHVQERQHWVASSYLDGEVQLYDSCSSGSLSPSLQEQLLQLYKLAEKDDQLMVTIVPIQQKRGPEDCGVYSIATAYDAALHKEHHTVTYKQEEMRHHLEMCFGENKLSSFPPSDNPQAVKRCDLKHIFIHVHVDSLNGMTRGWLSVKFVTNGSIISV